MVWHCCLHYYMSHVLFDGIILVHRDAHSVLYHLIKTRFKILISFFCTFESFVGHRTVDSCVQGVLSNLLIPGQLFFLGAITREPMRILCRSEVGHVRNQHSALVHLRGQHLWVWSTHLQVHISVLHSQNPKTPPK